MKSQKKEFMIDRFFKLIKGKKTQQKNVPHKLVVVHKSTLPIQAKRSLLEELYLDLKEIEEELEIISK